MKQNNTKTTYLPLSPILSKAPISCPLRSIIQVCRVTRPSLNPPFYFPRPARMRTSDRRGTESKHYILFVAYRPKTTNSRAAASALEQAFSLRAPAKITTHLQRSSRPVFVSAAKRQQTTTRSAASADRANQTSDSKMASHAFPDIMSGSAHARRRLMSAPKDMEEWN